MDDADEKGQFFDEILARCRAARAYLSDEEIVEEIVSEKKYTAEQVYLCIHSAKILDG